MAKDIDYTVGHFIELLQQFPKDALLSIEDMDGNAIYANCFAEHLDCDIPSVELIMPIYIHSLSIEPNEEENVFINSGTVDVVKEW